MSGSIPFAAYGIFEVREGDKAELLENEHVCAAFQYDNMSDQIRHVFDNLLTLPEQPGFYTFWIVGSISFGMVDCPSVGREYYEDPEVDTVVIEPAKQGCMEYLKNQIPTLTWPFEKVELDPKAKFFVIQPEDYKQHQHQHDINTLLVTDPAFAAETQGTRYTPAQLRLMASAHIRGLKVDLKTGQIALPPKE